MLDNLWLFRKSQIKVNVRTTDDGVTPLFVASVWGFVEVVKELLSHKQIDVNLAKITTGSTPLSIASEEGNVDVVKELLADPRVDPNKLRTSYKDYALSIAAWKGQLQVVKLLLRCPKVKLGRGPVEVQQDGLERGHGGADDLPLVLGQAAEPLGHGERPGPPD